MFANSVLARLAMTAGIAGSALTLSSAPSRPAIPTGSNADYAWVTVRTADLDLSNRDGAREMMARIKSAARHVCGPEPTDRLDFGRQYDECVRESVNRAVVDLGSPTVAALNGKTTLAANAN